MSNELPQESTPVSRPAEVNKVESSNMGGVPSLSDTTLKDFRELMNRTSQKDSKSDAAIEPDGSIIFNVDGDVNITINQGEAEDGEAESTGSPNRARDGAHDLPQGGRDEARRAESRGTGDEAHDLPIGGEVRTLGEGPTTARTSPARPLGEDPAAGRNPALPRNPDEVPGTRNIAPMPRPQIIPLPNPPLSSPNGYRGAQPGNGNRFGR